MSTVKIYWLNWVVVLRPTTDLFGDIEIEELQEAFKVGFGVLLSCCNLAQRTHTKVAICCIHPSILRILDMSGLGLFMNRRQSVAAFKSETDAIRYCRER